MSVNIDITSRKSAIKDPVIHHVPVEIKFDGDAKVSDYFTSGIRSSTNTSADVDECYTTSFRGRPLNGTKLPVPEGYTGLVLKELHKPFSEDEEREFKVTHEFREFTNWNLDLPPSSQDKIQQALQWVKIASSIHRPVKDEPSPKSDTSR